MLLTLVVPPRGVTDPRDPCEDTPLGGRARPDYKFNAQRGRDESFLLIILKRISQLSCFAVFIVKDLTKTGIRSYQVVSKGYTWHIISFMGLVPTRVIVRAAKYHAQLAKISIDDFVDLTANAFFFFYTPECM